jgi:amino acid transporter
MDDIILAGMLAIAGLYAAAVFAVAAVVVTLMALYGAAGAGNFGRVAVILAIVILFLVVYAGTGHWLQERGHF